MNRIGRRYGRLVVLKKSEPGGHQRQAKFLCQCDCGNQKTVSGGGLTSGNTKSCGCLRSDVSRTKATKHGMAHSAEHIVWISMIGRCHGRKGKRSDKYYKTRGIIVCDRWRESFVNFYADMGSRPSKHHSIERLDNNGNYEPSNCRWATKSEQMLNRRWGGPHRRNEYAMASLSFGV